MFLTLNHQKLDVYSASKEVVVEYYKLTNQLPYDRKFGVVRQIMRTAL